MPGKPIFGSILLLSLCAAAYAATDTADPRRELLRQEAQAAFPDVSRTLDDILEKANLNQRPSEHRIQQAAELLEENRRYAVLYDAPQKAVYMLLQSWTSYYQDDPVSNLNWAVRACREDMNNGDAWISQTVFSLIYGRRPLEPQPPRPQRQQPDARRPQRPQPRGRGAEMGVETLAQSTGAPFGQAGVLDFDLNTLRRDFLRERFSRQEYRTLDGQKVTYTPGSDMLCAFFWQAEEDIDPNLLTPGQRPPIEPEPSYSTAAGGNARYSLDVQQAYFEVFKDVLSSQKNVKFVEINTNSSVAAPKIVSEHDTVAPLVVASDPQSGAAHFARLQALSPFMVIADKEGQVKYAGPATGFMPAFILTHLTGVQIDLGEFQSAADSMGMSSRMPGEFDIASGRRPFEMMPPFDPNEPNRPADPNQIRPQAAPGRRPQAHQPAQLRELPEHQQIEAEKKLAYIRDLFIRGSRMGVQSYKRGIDMCREVIRDFPNTQYAEEARQLLRQVPERQRERYNVTDAEIGM